MAKVQTGLDALIAEAFRALGGRRVGLLTNPSAVDACLRSAYRVFADSPKVRLAALFSPEHGIAAVAADGATVASSTDPRTGVPIFSLYGETLRPTAEMLAEIDVLVCDIQDVGVRYYTYAWTLSHVLEAAGEHGVPVIVLDRPNPLDGITVQGPLLERAVASFVGRFPVTVRHGLTLGELATMVNATWNATPADLTVIEVRNWQRAQPWEALGRPWVPPSPAIAHLSTLQHYPGACLVEGTQLSEGRGTALPFELVGAPWIDGDALADRLNGDGWAEPMGARFRPHTFRPSASKWAGKLCGGVQVHITDAARWRPIEVWLGVIVTIYAMYPKHFAWLPQPKQGPHHFDRLIGGRWVRQQIEAHVRAGRAVRELIASLAAEWNEDANAFAEQRRPFLRYS